MLSLILKPLAFARPLFVAAIFCALFPLVALADRIVYFDVSGISKTLNTDEVAGANRFVSSCIITLTNSSTVDQTYIVTLAGTATATVGSTYDTTGQVGTFTGVGTKNGALNATKSTGTLNALTTLTAGGRALFVWEFPYLPSYSIATQEIRCTGSIRIDNLDPTTPGYVTANGMVNTWMQGPRTVNGTNEMRATTTISTTPFTIGEGRAF